ncbi:AMP-binding protein [Nocardia colli]|uniref:AMP-binding protein n=1 Tax=Nocardia colli TaxID=2545717 RepID=UPI001CC8055F|nr:AMP-binding protein [Nocardia colli]
MYEDRLGLIADGRQFTYGEIASRCRRMAGALAAEGVGPGSVVSVLAPNTGLALEAHFGVPANGAILNALNTRLSVPELAGIVAHAEADVLLVDHEFIDLARAIRAETGRSLRCVVAGGPTDEYEQWIGSAEPLDMRVDDEWQPISVNYTSGTTGRPKGAVYAHRGAFLQAMAMAAQLGLSNKTTFLWTLPMFHCNGWCFPWAVTAMGGVHIGLRRADASAIWRAIDEQGITHFNAAPTVLVALADHSDAHRIESGLKVATGGAPPAPALLERLESLNIEVTHLYGLTETYGPAVVCEWRPEWDALPIDERAQRKARQGVSNLVSPRLRVIDPAGVDVAPDGQTVGEVALRGNIVMLEYLNDPDATAAATVTGPGGSWFRTGDIAVLHPDGYLELRDRAKDVIISGGENIASIEVEQALASHPAVAECAVVGAPDSHWGEIPVAYIVLRDRRSATESEIVEHCKASIARFKAPRCVIFVTELPKTATGKIQKFLLRERLRDVAATTADGD